MNMLLHLLATTLCWLAFLGLYHWAFRNEKLLQLNRFYLLGSLITGALLPIVDVPGLFAMPASLDSYLVYLPALTVISPGEAPLDTASGIGIWEVLFGVWAVGWLWCLGRFLLQFLSIRRYWQQGEVERQQWYWLVKTEQVESPFSFFHLVFWKAGCRLDTPQAQTILRHEEAHIRQWHSLDILCLEWIGTFFWWNPVWHLYQKAIREVHEYLADQYALETTDTQAYGHLLIEQCLKGPHLAISHGWNHSSLKNRIHMMTKKSSSQMAIWKYSLSLPLAAALLIACEQAKQMEAPLEDIYTTDALDEAVVTGYRGQVSADATPVLDTTFTVDPETYATKMEVKEVYKEVEQMPTYGDCGSLSKGALADCSANNILTYIYKNIKYPAAARKAGIEGMAVVRLMVSKEGKVEGVRILRSLHPSIDQEVYDLVESMPDQWQPGLHRNQPVNVELVLPIKFRME